MPILLVTFLFSLIALSSLGQTNYLDQGNSYLNNGEWSKAEKTFRDGIKSEPNNLIYQSQLALTLIEQKKYEDAQSILYKILKEDNKNIGALWYSGIGYFYAADDQEAIKQFERVMPLLDKKGGQYFSANWFIGTCYSNLLKTSGLTFEETDRMFACLEEYIRLQPNAADATKLKEYIQRKKKRRPSSNVKRWVDQ